MFCRRKGIILFCLLLCNLVFTSAVLAAGDIVNDRQMYTYDIMKQDIAELKQVYGDLMEVEILGYSELGREIIAVKIGRGMGKIFINGAHHGREWITSILCMKMLEYYLDAYKNNKIIDGYDVKYLLTYNSIYFVPMVNPDGVTISQTGLASFTPEQQQVIRKAAAGLRDFRKWKANALGIDLNRQYDVNHGNAFQNPNRPYPWNWPGNYPEQAREARVIADFCRRIVPDIAVSYHAFGEIMYYDQYIKEENYVRDLSYARLISSLTGYKLATTGRPASGGFSPWLRKEFDAIAVTPEVGRMSGEYPVALSQFSRIWQQNRLVGLASCRFNLDLLKASPDRVNARIAEMKEFLRGETGKEKPDLDKIAACLEEIYRYNALLGQNPDTVYISYGEKFYAFPSVFINNRNYIQLKDFISLLDVLGIIYSYESGEDDSAVLKIGDGKEIHIGEGMVELRDGRGKYRETVFGGWAGQKLIPLGFILNNVLDLPYEYKGSNWIRIMAD